MRTTINFNDEVLEQVRQYAAGRSVPTGEAASYLLSHALNNRLEPTSKMALRSSICLTTGRW